MSKDLGNICRLVVSLLISEIAGSLVVGLPYDRLTWAAFVTGATISVAMIFLVYRRTYWAVLAVFVFSAIGALHPFFEIIKDNPLEHKILRAIEFAMLIWGAAICRRVLREISMAGEESRA
ncbi:MAG: hypothetical protein ACKO1J_10275 [Tagaea sp.]